ncbi:hypothetical protein Tco_1432456, partial [Tanacetum coccineum]
GIIEAAKDVMPLSEHRQCARHIYANFEKKFTGVQFRSLFRQAAKATYLAKFEKIMQEIKDLSIEAHKHLMERNPKSWSRAFFRTDRVCDAVENGISENWRVVPSGERRFKVRNGYEGFKVDERLRTCICRGWQLTGIPYQHGFAALYFLHREPKEYVSEWYRKDKFVSAYSHYIKGLNGMDQWPATSYQKPLPPIIRRMPRRPPHKRKRYAFENDGHNQRACPSKNEEGSAIDVVTSSTSTRGGTGSARGGSASTRGGNTSARGENTFVRGGSSSARGGSSFARGGKTFARGGFASARGGSTSARGGKTPTRGGKIVASSAPSSPSVGFEMSASQGVRMTRSGIRIRGGVYIRGRGDGSNEARSATNEAVRTWLRRVNEVERTGLRTVNGKVVRTRGRGDGSRSRMYPNGIRPI